MFKSLKWKVALQILALNVLLLGFLVAFMLSFSLKQINSNVNDLLNEEAGLTASKIDNFFYQVMEENRILAMSYNFV